MKTSLENNLENDLIWVYEHMNGFELFEEFCAYETALDKQEKNYSILLKELERRNKSWILELKKTSKKDVLFYNYLNERHLEPIEGNIFLLKEAIHKIYNYFTLNAGMIKVRLNNGQEKEMSYSETLSDCKPSRIREFSKRSYFHGEEIYKKLMGHH